MFQYALKSRVTCLCSDGITDCTCASVRQVDALVIAMTGRLMRHLTTHAYTVACDGLGASPHTCWFHCFLSSLASGTVVFTPAWDVAGVLCGISAAIFETVVRIKFTPAESRAAVVGSLTCADCKRSG